MSSPEDAVWRTDHASSLWLDLAEGRLRLDRLSRNDDAEDFLPLPAGPAFLARQESLPVAVLH